MFIELSEKEIWAIRDALCLADGEFSVGGDGKDWMDIVDKLDVAVEKAKQLGDRNAGTD